jgi:hypothetical protein
MDTPILLYYIYPYDDRDFPFLPHFPLFHYFHIFNGIGCLWT